MNSLGDLKIDQYKMVKSASPNSFSVYSLGVNPTAVQNALFKKSLRMCYSHKMYG